MNYARIYKIKDSTTSINSHNNNYDGSYIVRSDRAQLRQRFNDLATRWLAETRYISSLTDIVSNPSYLAIIKLGRPALPFIFSELERRPKFWFYALEAILGKNIGPQILEDDLGNLPVLTKKWLDWASENDY